MGCYNETCAITNLPIRWGDRVVGIILKKNTMDSLACVHPDDQWIPIGFPVFGEYDDYGGIEHATTHPWNQKFFGIKDKESDGTLNLEDFRMDKNLLFVHEEIYRQLINAVGSRIAVNCDQPYRTCLRTALLKKLKDQETVFSLKKPFQTGRFCDAELNRQFCEAYRNSDNEDEKDLAIETQLDCELFYTALMLLRKGYRTISGAGGQSLETALHILVARFTIDFGQKILTDEDNPNIEPNGNEESLFFFE